MNAKQVGIAVPRGLAVFSLVAAFLATFSFSARAALIPIAPPPSVVPGALESNVDAWVFVEKQVTLQAPIAVDISAPGKYDNSNPNSVGVIPAGTKVQSYFIHRDPVGEQVGSIIGVAIAPTKILGIITTDANLDATDALLGSPATIYPTGTAFRGMEIPYVIPDSLTWFNNFITIAFQSNAAAVTDQIRVIALVPEPPSQFLIMGALAGMWIFARRNRAQ